MKKKILALMFAVILCFSTCVSAFAAQKAPRVVDGADILTDAEEAELVATLDEISERQKNDIVVVTTYSLDGKSPMAYADDFYDYNGYGFGENYDGILLLISMEQRDFWISACGFGITAFTDAGIDYISEEIIYYLSDDEFASAFNKFATLSDDFLTQAKTGNPYDGENLPKEPFSVFFSLIASLVIGFVIALIVTGVMKGQLRSVRTQAAANSYVKKDSLKITNSRDLFLYRHIDRRERPKESSGSSTHTSSSGRTHGGGGGKF